MESVTPMAELLEDSVKFKHSFDIYECLCPCEECTGSYSGAGIKVRCMCSCGHKVGRAKMTQQEQNRRSNIVDKMHKVQNDHFELFGAQHQEIDETLNRLGYIDETEYNKTALTHCGTKSYYKKQDNGSIMRIDIATYSNICGYCHKQTDELDDIQDYIPRVLCKECLAKIDTNEIKLTDVYFGEFLLDSSRDNSCDRCHNQFNHTELNRTCYRGQSDDEYLCSPCLEIAKKEQEKYFEDLEKTMLQSDPTGGTDNQKDKIRKGLSEYEGFIEDIFKQEKKNKSNMQKILVRRKQIKSIDTALKQLVIDHNLAPVKIEKDDV
jgi:hypothetical protein